MTVSRLVFILDVFFLICFVAFIGILLPVINQCEVYFAGNADTTNPELIGKEEFYWLTMALATFNIVCYYIYFGLLITVYALRKIKNSKMAMCFTLSLVLVIAWMFISNSFDTEGKCDLILGPADSKLISILVLCIFSVGSKIYFSNRKNKLH